VELARQGSNALLTVTNPGFLTREQCRSIFRRFYRADPARTAGGSGLGLAIAQGIALDHGGRIWADSREGTVILSVCLPLIK
jgi:signal transduction histidine kinase